MSLILSFIVFQLDSDPRTLQHQNSYGNGGPNQSKSFIVLQKTLVEPSGQEQQPQSNLDDEPGELQQPMYSRPLGPAEMNENQLRKLQLADKIKTQGKIECFDVRFFFILIKNSSVENSRR